MSRWCRISNIAQKFLGVDNLNELELRLLQDVLENEFTIIDTRYEGLTEIQRGNLDQTIVKRHEDI